MANKEIKEDIIKETKMLVNLFTLTNASDIDLSKITGITSSTVGRRLTNKENIMKAFPNDGEKIYEEVKLKRQENLQRGKTLGGQTTLLNHVYSNKESDNVTPKINLEALYSKKENQDKFLIHSALFFRLHLDTLSSLLQVEEKEIYERIIKINDNLYPSLLFLFNNDAKDQKRAKAKFINYYKELLNATRLKDVERKRKLMDLISDKHAIDFIKKHKHGEEISDIELKHILKYQLKYALTSTRIADIFNISDRNYLRRLYVLFETELELKNDYEYLSDCNQRNVRNSK